VGLFEHPGVPCKKRAEDLEHRRMTIMAVIQTLQIVFEPRMMLMNKLLNRNLYMTGKTIVGGGGFVGGRDQGQMAARSSLLQLTKMRLGRTHGYAGDPHGPR
jgi:hypothetical protein